MNLNELLLFSMFIVILPNCGTKMYTNNTYFLQMVFIHPLSNIIMYTLVCYSWINTVGHNRFCLRRNKYIVDLWSARASILTLPRVNIFNCFLISSVPEILLRRIKYLYCIDDATFINMLKVMIFKINGI